MSTQTSLLSLFRESSMLGLMTLLLFSCEEAEKEVTYPDIDFYDFEAAAPWFGAEGLSYADGTTVVTAFEQVDQFSVQRIS